MEVQMVTLIGSIGGLLIFIAQVWVAMVAFRKGVVWGLLVLCVPVVTLVFILLNWSETNRAILLYVLGSLMVGWAGNSYQQQLPRHAAPHTSEA
jgi:hypothetical protein